MQVQSLDNTPALLRRTLDGDLDAFGEVVTRFKDMAFGCAYSILGDFEDAEDATQEAFVTAFRKLPDLREPERFPGWLRRLVLTACDRARRRPRVGTAGLEAAETVPSPHGNPARHAEIAETREAILAAFRGHAWLRGLHVHVGSQGCDLDLLVRAAARVAELREEIDAMLGEARIGHVDIGGGLPVAYGAGDRPPSLDEYVARLRAAAPSLLDGRARLITELGRAVQAGCGFAATRVEYVKEGGGTRIAVGHLGADLLLRPVYNPQDWRHELVVLDAGGTLKDGPTRPWSVAGPLCFAGDFIARDVELPEIVPGDWLLIRDTGAYTLSMWSRHCSRALPPVVGFRGDEMWLLHEGEEPRDVVAFWGG